MYLSDLNFDTALKYVSGATVLIPLVAFIVYRHWLRGYSLLGWYFGITLVAEIAGLSTLHLKCGNLFIYKPYSLVEMSLWATLYLKYGPRWLRPWIIIPTLALINIGLYRYLGNIYFYDKVILSGCRMMIIYYGILWLIYSFETNLLRFKTLMDWLNLAGFMYYFCTVSLFYHGDILSYQIPFLADLWNGTLIWNIAFHVFLTCIIIFSLYRPLLVDSSLHD